MQVHFGADLNCSESKNDGANVLHPLGKEGMVPARSVSSISCNRLSLPA